MKRWDEIYEYAKYFYEEHGNLLIPINYEMHGVKLGHWINNQRHTYKIKKLSIDKIQKLESIGMIWDVNEVVWQETYELAKNYYMEHGNLFIPRNYEVDGVKLGIWVNYQKLLYKQHKISMEKREKLELIKIRWWLPKMSWDEFLELTKSYSIEHDDLLSKIYDIVTTYEIDVISNFLNKTDVCNIIEDLKNNLDRDSYSILILHLLNIDIKKISNIFKLDIDEIEKIRLKGMKIILENCLKKDDNIKTKS